MSQYSPATGWDEIGEVVAIIFVAFAVFGWLAWSRWLSHKETMRLTELGGGAHELLRSRERWRLRHGLLWAIRLLVLGLVIGVFGVLGLRALAMVGARGGHSGTQVAMAGPLLLIALAFIVVGAVTLVAYAIWSRRDEDVLSLGLLGDEKKTRPAAGEEAEEEPEAGRESEGERSE
jgi:hypothetical protein